MERYLKVNTRAESRSDSATAEACPTNSAGAFKISTFNVAQRSTLGIHEMVYGTKKRYRTEHHIDPNKARSTCPSHGHLYKSRDRLSIVRAFVTPLAPIRVLSKSRSPECVATMPSIMLYIYTTLKSGTHP